MISTWGLFIHRKAAKYWTPPLVYRTTPSWLRSISGMEGMLGGTYGVLISRVGSKGVSFFPLSNSGEKMKILPSCRFASGFRNFSLKSAMSTTGRNTPMTHPFTTTGDTHGDGRLRCGKRYERGLRWLSFRRGAATKPGRFFHNGLCNGVQGPFRDGGSDHGGPGIVQIEGLKKGFYALQYGRRSGFTLVHGFGVVRVQQCVSHHGGPGPHLSTV